MEYLLTSRRSRGSPPKNIQCQWYHSVRVSKCFVIDILWKHLCSADRPTADYNKIFLTVAYSRFSCAWWGDKRCSLFTAVWHWRVYSSSGDVGEGWWNVCGTPLLHMFTLKKHSLCMCTVISVIWYFCVEFVLIAGSLFLLVFSYLFCNVVI